MEILGYEARGKHIVLAILAFLVALAACGAILFRATCVKFVDNYELGYRFDRRDGKITRVGRTGYIVHLPILVDVHTVDLRPMQVCINANARVLNCKLVQFNPDGLETFLAWHGRANYEAPSSSGNTATSSSTSTSTTNFSNILMSYAFDGSGKNYPFLKVIRELKPEEAASETTAAIDP